MILDFQKLYEPYSKDASLQTTLQWLEREARNRGIPDDVRDTVIGEVFLEMARGKTFSTTSCSCSPDCPFRDHPWSSAEMNHYTLQRMLLAQQQLQQDRAIFLQEKVNTLVLQHIEEQNAEFIQEHMKPNLLKRIWNWMSKKEEEGEDELPSDL